MSIVNLADAKVSYEGQTCQAVNLISKLQVQLQEAASRIAVIAATLGEVQTSLMNSHTVDVKLTLSKDDYHKFKTIGGADDSDRIRKAILNTIQSSKEEDVQEAPIDLVSPVVPVETRVAFQQPQAPAAPVAPAVFAVQETVAATPPPPLAVEPLESAGDPAPKKKPTTKCPRCQSLIDLPDISSEQWPVEVKCGNCGAKCLIKSKTMSASKTDKAGFEPLDEAAYGKLFDMLST
jgi:hypothetical protein